MWVRSSNSIQNIQHTFEDIVQSYKSLNECLHESYLIKLDSITKTPRVQKMKLYMRCHVDSPVASRPLIWTSENRGGEERVRRKSRVESRTDDFAGALYRRLNLLLVGLKYGLEPDMA